MPGILDDVLEQMSKPAPLPSEGVAPQTTIAQISDQAPGKKKMFSYSSAWEEEYGSKPSTLGE